MDGTVCGGGTLTRPESPWLVVHSPRPAAKAQLLCFPHAGSSAALYRHWHEFFPAELEVVAVEYPGRGRRRPERRFTRISSLVPAAVGAIADSLTKPFIAFGHSLGALIGFECLRHLHHYRGRRPIALLAAGCRGPSVPARRGPIYALPDDRFINELKRLNGTPPELLADSRLLNCFLPVLRSDLEMMDLYAYERLSNLDCEIVTYGGQDDSEASPDDLDAWAFETQGAFARRVYAGSHFFLSDADSPAFAALREDVAALLQRLG
jgi:medium-chain acyl-[acyl-carrier-protein] hydrolase